MEALTRYQQQDLPQYPEKTSLLRNSEQSEQTKCLLTSKQIQEIFAVSSFVFTKNGGN